MNTIFELRQMFINVMENVVGRNSPDVALYYTVRTLDDDYRGIILWAPANYVWVFDILSTTPLMTTFEDFQRHVKSMRLMSCHDSCWRDDGVDVWFRKYRTAHTQLDAFSGLRRINITDEYLKQYFRSIRQSD